MAVGQKLFANHKNRVYIATIFRKSLRIIYI